MIVIISGTNRKGALSRGVANMYQTMLSKLGQDSMVVDLADLPTDYIFSALYENSGRNEQMNRFRAKVEEASKFIFVVPEYNGSFPGVLKAFIDGLKYPDSFAGKKSMLVGISSGVQGGALALSHLNDILSYLNMNVLGTRLKIPMVEKNFTGDGIADAKIAQLIEQQLKSFINF